MRRTEDINGVV